MKKKLTRKVLTPEEQDAYALARALEGIHFIPAPTRTFKIGEEVRVGHLDDCIVEGVFEDGKLYKINYTTINRDGVFPGRTGYWNWLSVYQREFPEDHDLIRNEDVRLNFYNTSLDSLIHKQYHAGIDMDPPYQRGYVWDDADRDKLLNSVFTNIDIGKFVLVKQEDRVAYDIPYFEILDGKQRLHTLCAFYEGRYKWNGLTYADLSFREKSFFDARQVACAEVSYTTEKQKLELFLLVNTNGRIVSEEHLEKVRRLIDNE